MCAALKIKRITGRQEIADLILIQVGSRSAKICRPQGILARHL